MSDSLSRLVLRAQGRLPMAAPLLRSRYADAGATEAWGEEISETTALAEPVAAPMPTVQAPRMQAAERVREAAPPPARPIAAPPSIEPRPSPSPSSEQPQQVRAQLPQAPPADAPPASPPPVARQTRAVHPPPTAAPTSTDTPRRFASADPAPVVPTPQNATRDGRQAPPNERKPEERPRPNRQDQVHVAPRAPDVAAPAQRPAAPEVRISIGRVEVHAAPAPVLPVPPPRSTSVRQPTVSLADYLAGRGRAG